MIWASLGAYFDMLACEAVGGVVNRQEKSAKEAFGL
jgi:hypothetical protein